MKILFIGQLAEGQTSRMRMESLRDMGHDVIPFNTQTAWNQIPWFSRRFQEKLNRGPIIAELNKRVLKLVTENKPDFLWAEKQEYLNPDTLFDIINQGVRTLHFTPDPYFTLSWKRTPLMDACMPLFDYVVTSKKYELAEYERKCQKAIYMPLGFSMAVHRPYSPANRQKARQYCSDVGFLGGWEPRREHLLDEVRTHVNCHLKIWGYSWDHLQDGRWTPRRAYRLRLLAGEDSFRIQQKKKLAQAWQGGEVYGDTYAWALSGAKIGVGFLRAVCPDQHTTRTFEIPACGSMMLADRTDEHLSFFTEGEEAEFFSSTEELVDKVHYYLVNESARSQIAYQGYRRCLRSGYSYLERIRQVMDKIQTNI